ncbi:uncharacterized protein N7482_009622 [Penicillium canariense]|uniref:Altered inheritance of mitochondria protein 11 n=1 Tax=Penicillium canariense TaxID=189055 RepID=A0A9W9LFW2_9EURO|nr:uncharacterized protein N7482_009622 [Penicillium canariense]KAJ5153144.1 hypothetical protein N7482_009622 [Penicillium canariense]
MVSFFSWGSSSKSDSDTPKPQECINTILPPQPPSQPPQLAQQFASQDNTNLKLFCGGLAFFALSLYITRRATIRRRLACMPPFYSSSVYFQPNVNGAMEAFEALNLATINVISFSMMASGGVMCALNVNSLEDMRKVMRGSLEGVAAGKSDEELEKEVAEWVSSVLGDRFDKQLEKEKAKKRTVDPKEETS